MEKPSLSLPLSSEAHVMSLEEFIARNVSELPQMVQVDKGFCGTSANQSIKTGDVLIIYKVERERKVKAKHSSSGRTLCLPRISDLKLELVSEHSQDEFTTLDAIAKLPSAAFIRIVENVPLFGLLAGDILQISRDPPYLNLSTVRCFIVNLKDPVQMDLPLTLEGRFQVLANHGIFTTDEVLQNCTLPVNVRVVSYGNKAMVDGSSEHPRAKQRSIFGKILVECEIEEEVVYAISTREQNILLMFPSTLDMNVAQCMSRERFTSRWGAEFEKLLEALPNETVLHELSNTNCISFTSDPVKRCSLESLQHFCFPFDCAQGIETSERQVSRVGFEFALDPPSMKEETATKEKGFQKFQPESFSEMKAPPLPPKVALIATRSHASSQEDLTKNFDNKQETEMEENSFETIDKQVVLSEQSLTNDLNDDSLPPSQSCVKLLEDMSQPQEGSKHSDVGDVNCKMQISGDIPYESEEPLFLASFTKRKAYEPSVDRNANVPSDEGLPVERKREQFSVRVLRPAQTGSDLPRREHGALPEATDDPLSSREKEADLDLNFESSEANTNKKHNMQKDEEASSEQSDEENNNFDDLDPDCSKKMFFEHTENDNEISLPSLGAKSKEEHRMNGESTKRKFFQSLTLMPRMFRQDPSRAGRKKEQAPKEKSNSVRIPPRKATSCDNILISSPRDDDFESMTNIKKYLETQAKLDRALVQINRLQNQRSKNLATGTKPKNSIKSVNAQETGLREFESGGSSETENEVEEQNPRNVFPEQTGKERAPHTQANTSEQSSPAPATFALRQATPTWLNQNPKEKEISENCEGETYGRRPEIPHDRSPHFSIEPTDAESVMPLDRASQRENGRSHGSSRRENDENGPNPGDSNETCWSYRTHFTSTFGVELNECEMKSELKKTIQQTKWTTDELMELIEILRRKLLEVNRVPYVNLAPSQERQRSLSEDLVNAHGPSSFPAPNEITRKDKPPYVNISQASGEPNMPSHQNLVQDSRDPFTVKDLKTLPNRSHGKPPIPTPRSTLSSI